MRLAFQMHRDQYLIALSGLSEQLQSDVMHFMHFKSRWKTDLKLFCSQHPKA